MFIWIVCFVVFIPLGADVAVLIGWEGSGHGLAHHFALFAITVIIAFIDSKRRNIVANS